MSGITEASCRTSRHGVRVCDRREAKSRGIDTHPIKRFFIREIKVRCHTVLMIGAAWTYFRATRRQICLRSRRSITVSYFGDASWRGLHKILESFSEFRIEARNIGIFRRIFLKEQLHFSGFLSDIRTTRIPALPDIQKLWRVSGGPHERDVGCRRLPLSERRTWGSNIGFWNGRSARCPARSAHQVPDCNAVARFRRSCRSWGRPVFAVGAGGHGTRPW